jgi:hypothetical protein
MMPKNRRRQKASTEAMPFCVEFKQLLPWLWTADEAKLSCPGCGRHLSSGWKPQECFQIPALEHPGVAIFCKTEYGRTRKTKIVNDVFGQRLIAELEKLVETGEGGFK